MVPAGRPEDSFADSLLSFMWLLRILGRLSEQVPFSAELALWPKSTFEKFILYIYLCACVIACVHLCVPSGQRRVLEPLVLSEPLNTGAGTLALILMIEQHALLITEPSFCPLESTVSNNYSFCHIDLLVRVE